MENWKEIEGFNGRYLISDKGRVYSNISNKILKPSCDKDGYIMVKLYLNSKQYTRKIHRLVG